MLKLIGRISKAKKLAQILEFKEKQLVELQKSLDVRNDEVYQLTRALSTERRRNRNITELNQQATQAVYEMQEKLSAYEARQHNAIYQDIDKLINAQTVKGLQKYGEAVHAHNLTSLEWLDHALEESADKLVYLTALKQTMTKEVQQ